MAWSTLEVQPVIVLLSTTRLLKCVLCRADHWQNGIDSLLDILEQFRGRTPAPLFDEVPPVVLLPLPDVEPAARNQFSQSLLQDECTSAIRDVELPVQLSEMCADEKRLQSCWRASHGRRWRPAFRRGAHHRIYRGKDSRQRFPHANSCQLWSGQPDPR